MGLVMSSEFTRICEKHEIALVYAFGSQQEKILHVLGKTGCVLESDPMADADLGVVFRFPFGDIETHHKLYAAVFNDLEDLVKPFPLDLVFLQQCHSVMQFEAIKGHCLYQVTEDFRDGFEMNVLRRLPDFRRMLNEYNAERLESQDGTSSS